MDIEPTFRGYIEDEKDALLIIQATMDGKLRHIPRRPYEIERSYLITSGNIFVFIEEISGIKRWTDGVTWSPSRIAGKFLIYKEINKAIIFNKNKFKHLPKKSEYINNKSMNPKNKKSFIQVSDVNNKEIPAKSRIKLLPLLNNRNGGNGNKDGSNISYKTTNVNVMRRKLNYLEPLGNQSSSDSNDDSNGENIIDYPKNNNQYFELSKKVPFKSLHSTKYTGLIKKTISVSLRRKNSKQQETFHVVSYYTIDDVRKNRLITPKDSLVFRNTKLSRELIQAMENIKLGNPKIITKEKNVSTSPENVSSEDLESTSNIGTHQSSHYVPNHYSNTPTTGTSNIIQPNSSSASMDKHNDNVDVNFGNNIGEGTPNSQNPSTFNNMIPVISSSFGDNSNDKFNPKNNINLNNDATGFPSSIPPNEYAVKHGPYYINQSQSIPNNILYMNAENGNIQNGMFNSVDVNAGFPGASVSHLNPHQNHNNPYGYYYYQGATNGNGYSIGDPNINNGIASQNQIIHPVAPGLTSSSDTGYLNMNTFQGNSTTSNNVNNIIPAIRTNATYTLYPVTISPGTNNQISSIANNNAAVTNNNIGNHNINYLNNSVSYPIQSATHSFITSNNTTRVVESSLGNMVPTPVSIQNKNISNNLNNLSYVGKYNNGSTTNYFEIPRGNIQIGPSLTNQQMNISSDLNNTKTEDTINNSFDSSTKYTSNTYIYPGTQNSNN